MIEIAHLPPQRFCLGMLIDRALVRAPAQHLTFKHKLCPHALALSSHVQDRVLKECDQSLGGNSPHECGLVDRQSPRGMRYNIPRPLSLKNVDDLPVGVRQASEAARVVATFRDGHGPFAFEHTRAPRGQTRINFGSDAKPLDPIRKTGLSHSLAPLGHSLAGIGASGVRVSVWHNGDGTTLAVQFQLIFMANIVLPGGRTVSEEIRPMIASAYETGKVQALLPDYSA